jgi:hypothetical protein
MSIKFQGNNFCGYIKKSEITNQFETKPETSLADAERMLGRQKPSRVTTWLHMGTGLLLLLFGVSHLFLLVVAFPDANQLNIVFPFLSNRGVYLIVGLVEILLALFVFRSRVSSEANITILAFVASLLWYRWAFYFSGGRDCGCVGALGYIFGISKRTADLLPILALVFMVCSILPWGWGILKKSATHFLVRRRSAVTGAFVLGNICMADAGTSVVIYGKLDSADYNPRTGGVYSNTISHADFKVRIANDLWNLSVTNSEFPAWRCEVAFDGSATIVRVPFGGNFSQKSAPVQDHHKARIRPGDGLLPIEGDPMGVSLLWVAYGLSRSAISNRSQASGAVDYPLPWEVRSMSFGYAWECAFESNRLFLTSSRVVRDKRFDLDDKQEFLRPALRYPESQATKNEYLEGFSARRGIPTGFIAANYSCSAWVNHIDGSGFSTDFPSTCEMEVFMSPPYTQPRKKMRLAVTKIENLEQGEPLIPAIANKISVDDFRARRIEGGKILACANYEINLGDKWRVGLTRFDRHLEERMRMGCF